MSGWFLLASVIVQYQRKIKLLNKLNKSQSWEKFRLDLRFHATPRNLYWSKKLTSQLTDCSISVILRIAKMDLHRRISWNNFRNHIIKGKQVCTSNSFVNKIKPLYHRGLNVFCLVSILLHHTRFSPQQNVAGVGILMVSFGVFFRWRSSYDSLLN